MNPVSLILKVIANLGQISGDLKDFEQAGKDLFAGKLTKDEVTKLLTDIGGILSSGLISIPGVDSSQVVAAIGSGEKIVDDVIKAVKDVEDKQPVEQDLGQALSDIRDLITNGVLKNFGGNTKEQVIEVIDALAKAL